MALLKHRNALAILLVTVSLIALAPTFISASKPNQVGAIQINATGQATPLNKGKGTSSSATLSLTGSALTEGNGQLKLQDLSGLLQIGSTNYAVSNGQGDVNNKGTVEINAKTNGGNNKNELVLHGSLQGSNIMFDSHESKLSSMFFLALSGQASITQSATSGSSTGENENEGATTTVTHNITVTQTNVVTSTQNNTIVQNVTQTVNNTITKTETLNQTITQTLTIPTNVTVTTTELLNQTITVTQTQTTNATTTETVTITTTSNSTTTGP